MIQLLKISNQVSAVIVDVLKLVQLLNRLFTSHGVWKVSKGEAEAENSNSTWITQLRNYKRDFLAETLGYFARLKCSIPAHGQNICYRGMILNYMNSSHTIAFTYLKRVKTNGHNLSLWLSPITLNSEVHSYNFLNLFTITIAVHSIQWMLSTCNSAMHFFSRLSANQYPKMSLRFDRALHIIYKCD